MLIKTDAIILKSMKYRDTSKIVTVYSREYGKLQCLAKGARSNKSKFGASLEPLTHSQLLLYKKEHRELHLLSQGTVLTHFKKIVTSLLHLSFAFGVAELVHRSTPYEEKNHQLFELVLQTLQELDGTDEPEKYFYAFQIQWAAFMGFAPSLETCVRCGAPLHTFSSSLIRITNGSALCERCASPQGTHMVFDSSHTVAVRLSAEALVTLRFLATHSLEALRNFHIARETGNEIEKMLRFYVQHHSGYSRPLQAFELLHRI